MKHQKENVLCLVKYVKVTNANPNSMEVVDLDNNEKFSIIGKDLCDQCQSADYYDSTEECTKTQLAEILVGCWNKPFTVEFEKADKKLRTLRGRLVSTESILGRSMVEDLDLPANKRIRQVDHRTIKSIIVDGVKYQEQWGKNVRSN